MDITYLTIKTLNDLENLKNTYDIYYIDKETPDKLQNVSIEDENNIQIDKGIVLSFDKIDSKNPNSELYLWGIYNGEFKEVTEEVVDPETKGKTTETKKILTEYVNIFYQNGNITIQGSLENGLFKQGKYYREDGTLWLEGAFTKNEDGYTVLHGDDCKRYYENGKSWRPRRIPESKEARGEDLPAVRRVLTYRRR